MENDALKQYGTPSALPRFGSIQTIINLLGTGHDVLDVGCSEGYLGRYDNRRNRFWGLDYNGAAVKMARAFYEDARCVDLNAEKIDGIFDRKFDIVVFADVLEHVLDPKSLLRSVRSLLKDSGTIIVSLPNVALWRVRMNLLFGKFDYTEYGVLDDTHLHLYTFASGRRLVESCGYRVVRTIGTANELGLLSRYVRPLRDLASINVVMTCDLAAEA